MPEPEWRERILRGMTVLALMEGEPSTAQLQWLQATATALSISDTVVTSFRHVLSGQFNLVRLDIARRGFQKGATLSYLRDEGMDGALQIARHLLHQEDPDLAAQYRQLAGYPEASLGRAYISFIDRYGFSLPGERGGPLPPVVRHDCCHVLGGYDSSDAGECGVIGFQAGFGHIDPFYTILFALAQLQLGIGSTPFNDAESDHVTPEAVIRGLVRGSRVSRDLISDGDPWDDFDKPLDVVRDLYGIAP